MFKKLRMRYYQKKLRKLMRETRPSESLLEKNVLKNKIDCLRRFL